MLDVDPPAAWPYHRCLSQSKEVHVGTGAKIAIGCVIAVVVAGIIGVAVIVGGAYWVKNKAKSKLEEVVAEQKQIDEFQQKADANPFTRPADGRIREAQLLKFLEVRKAVFAVYQKHEKELEARQHKQTADLGDVRMAFNILNEIRLAQARTEAAQGMSSEEYRFLVEQVYKSAWASEVDKSTGGTNVSEAASGASDKAAREMERQAEESGMPEEAKKAMREAAEKLRRGSEEIEEQTRSLEVPRENIELFRKHESEIKKYAMTGLEVIGL
jgi:hypothetical protein